MNTSLLSRLFLLLLLLSPAAFGGQDSGAVYFTNGVHNNAEIGRAHV